MLVVLCAWCVKPCVGLTDAPTRSVVPWGELVRVSVKAAHLSTKP